MPGTAPPHSSCARDATARPRLALVANSKAGALLAEGGGAAALHGLLEQAGFDVLPIPSGPLPQRLEQARDCGADLIVVAGGDGSVACAAQALVGHPTVLGLIPAGTMNLLAKDLGIPTDDPAAAIRLLAEGGRRDIDVGELTGAEGVRHAFLCAAMFGSPARLGHHRETGRRHGNGLFGWLWFARAFVRAARRHRALRLDVTVDGIVHRIRTPSLTIAVNALDDGTSRLFGRSRLDGGELYLYALQHRSAGAFLRVLFRALRGGLANDPDVTVLHGKEVLIDGSTAALRVLADGEERLVTAPARIAIAPHKLAVMAAVA